MDKHKCWWCCSPKLHTLGGPYCQTIAFGTSCMNENRDLFRICGKGGTDFGRDCIKYACQYLRIVLIVVRVYYKEIVGFDRAVGYCWARVAREVVLGRYGVT